MDLGDKIKTARTEKWNHPKRIGRKNRTHRTYDSKNRKS